MNETNLDNPITEAAPTELQHAALIRAVLDGKEIERITSRGARVYTTDVHGKEEAIRDMLTYSEDTFRVKVEPIVQWLVATKYSVFQVHGGEAAVREFARDHDGKVLRLELDGDTLGVLHHGTRTEEP